MAGQRLRRTEFHMPSAGLQSSVGADHRCEELRAGGARSPLRARHSSPDPPTVAACGQGHLEDVPPPAPHLVTVTTSMAQDRERQTSEALSGSIVTGTGRVSRPWAKTMEVPRPTSGDCSPVLVLPVGGTERTPPSTRRPRAAPQGYA